MKEKSLKLAQRLTEQGRMLEKNGEAATNTNGRKALERMEKAVPVRTGRLRHSLARQGGKVYTLCPYAKFVELGTGFMSPRLFMTRSFHRKESLNNYKEALKKSFLS